MSTRYMHTYKGWRITRAMPDGWLYKKIGGDDQFYKSSTLAEAKRFIAEYESTTKWLDRKNPRGRRNPVSPYMSSFIRSYLETALGMSSDGDSDRPLGERFGAVDFVDDQNFQRRIQAAEAFLEDNQADIDVLDIDDGQVAFWLWGAQTGAGVGFTDDIGSRSTAQYKAAAKRLQAAAHKLGDINVLIGDDGQLYLWP
jgi:hypothetical protein